MLIYPKGLSLAQTYVLRIMPLTQTWLLNTSIWIVRTHFYPKLLKVSLQILFISMNNAILNCNIAIMNNHATNFLSLKSNFHISTTFPVLTTASLSPRPVIFDWKKFLISIPMCLLPLASLITMELFPPFFHGCCSGLLTVLCRHHLPLQSFFHNAFKWFQVQHTKFPFIL